MKHELEKVPTTMVEFLTSEHVSLRAVEESDYAHLARWINNPIFSHFLFYGQLPMNQGQVEAMFREQAESPSNVVFMIDVVEKGKMKPIGITGLYDIHPRSLKAEFRVHIGETKYWGKGLGLEITQLMMFYGFDRLNLHRISLGVTAENTAAVSTYVKAGFIKEGVIRDGMYRNSRYYDDVLYGILRDEYYKKYFEKHKKRFSPSFERSRR